MGYKFHAAAASAETLATPILCLPLLRSSCSEKHTAHCSILLPRLFHTSFLLCSLFAFRAPFFIFAAPAPDRKRRMTPFLEHFRSCWDSRISKLCFCVFGVMSTLVVYGVMQEKIMRVPYGEEKDYFRYSLFIVLCNRMLTVTVSAIILLNRRKTIAPVAPMYKYGAVSISNILTTTCQYEALKYVSFPVQTLAKCAKMIPVMVWGTLIMQKRYTGRDYVIAFLVTLGCAVFILYPAGSDLSPYMTGKESSLWGILLMAGYLGFDGFTSTFQDKLFKGYNMDIYNQVFYVTLCSSFLSISGLLVQGHWFPAMDFIRKHSDCLRDIMLLSTVATASQFFISYTIRTFGALIFSIIMTTRQLASILFSCLWFTHPLSWQQTFGGIIVFGSLYFRSFITSKAKTSGSIRSTKLNVDEENLDENLLINGGNNPKDVINANAAQTST